MKIPSTLAQKIKQAKKIFALWAAEKQNSIQLQGSNDRVNEYPPRAFVPPKPMPPATKNNSEKLERDVFEKWATEHLGQGYSLDRFEGVYEDKVTRWAFVAWKAGRAALRQAEK